MNKDFDNMFDFIPILSLGVGLQNMELNLRQLHNSEMLQTIVNQNRKILNYQKMILNKLNEKDK